VHLADARLQRELRVVECGSPATQNRDAFAAQAFKVDVLAGVRVEVTG
jgi:hypothetical protein